MPMTIAKPVLSAAFTAGGLSVDESFDRITRADIKKHKYSAVSKYPTGIPDISRSVRIALIVATTVT